MVLLPISWFIIEKNYAYILVPKFDFVAKMRFWTFHSTFLCITCFGIYIFFLSIEVKYLRRQFFSLAYPFSLFLRLVLSRMDHMNASIILNLEIVNLQSKIVPWRGSFLEYLLTIMYSVVASHVLG